MKRALVTGGSGAIGQAVSEELARRGFEVIVHAQSNLAKAQACAERIKSSGGQAWAVAIDLTSPDSHAEIEALSRDTPVQALVHCSGMQIDKPFAAMELDDWQRVIDVNLTSFFHALRPLIMPMMRARWGRVIAISSLTAVRGHRGQANYAAAKGGLLPLVKTLTQEYGKRGITANVVAPGLIETDETRALANYAELVKMAPVARAGTTEEVAALVGFLASDAAGYISGQQICIDGGSS